MAAIVKFGNVRPTTMAWAYENQWEASVAETAGIHAGDAMYLDSTGRWKLCTPTSAGGAGATGARAMFFAAEDAANGQPLTGLKHVVFHYGSQLTPGSKVYLADNTGGTKAGQLDTQAPYTNASPVGLVMDTQRILLYDNWQLSL